MARNELNSFRAQAGDRARLRAGVDASANSWRALASVTVASVLVIAVVVSAFALVEAVFSKPSVQLAGVPAASAWQSEQANAQ